MDLAFLGEVPVLDEFGLELGVQQGELGAQGGGGLGAVGRGHEWDV